MGSACIYNDLYLFHAHVKTVQLSKNITYFPSTTDALFQDRCVFLIERCLNEHNTDIPYPNVF